MFALILVSSLLLGIDWPGWDDDEPVKEVFLILDYIFTVIFALECVLKIIVYGATRHALQPLILLHSQCTRLSTFQKNHLKAIWKCVRVCL